MIDTICRARRDPCHHFISKLIRQDSLKWTKNLCNCSQCSECLWYMASVLRISGLWLSSLFCRKNNKHHFNIPISRSLNICLFMCLAEKPKIIIKSASLQLYLELKPATVMALFNAGLFIYQSFEQILLFWSEWILMCNGYNSLDTWWNLHSTLGVEIGSCHSISELQMNLGQPRILTLYCPD